jgi:hypothetical protein
MPPRNSTTTTTNTTATATNTERRRALARLIGLPPALAAAAGPLVARAAAAADAAVGTAAAPLHLASGPRPTPVLELYTSQGCSSCPPAERWLSGLTTHPRLWQTLVPLAFHVDYWDHLGWRDPYASARHSQRQRDLLAQGATRSVYTPGFVLAGREWRGWFQGQPLPEAGNDAPVGVLRLDRRGDTVTLVFTPDPARPAPAGLSAQVAQLGFGLQDDVARGENAGRRLAQDFVVLAHWQADAQGPLQWRTRWPADRRGRRQAIVAWLSLPGRVAPYQAVGGWLD